MIGQHIRMAVRTIRNSRARSMLTMLGIIIGVSSVVLSVALAQGLRANTSKQLKQLGDSFITVQPGGPSDQANVDHLRHLDIASLLRPTNVASTLTPKDYGSIDVIPEVAGVAPVTIFNSSISNETAKLGSRPIIATSPDFPGVLDKQVDTGAFFADSEVDRPFAVLGHDISQELFGNDTPLGSTITIRDQVFTVLGVMQAETTSNVRIGPAFDKAVFVSIPSATRLVGEPRFQFIYLNAVGDKQTTKVAQTIRQTILAGHGGEEDFSVLTRADAIAISNQETQLVTTITILIMSISLLVAGIGIMNVMLMLVTERTREIGIRKALGATNRQIALQFFTEAMVLSTVGGLTGLSLSGLVIALVNAYTTVKMAVSIPLLLLGLAIPLIIGGFFGIVPALRAARKDPIDALRNQ